MFITTLVPVGELASTPPQLHFRVGDRFGAHVDLKRGGIVVGAGGRLERDHGREERRAVKYYMRWPLAPSELRELTPGAMSRTSLNARRELIGAARSRSPSTVRRLGRDTG
jgi:hypothetical protein